MAYVCNLKSREIIPYGGKAPRAPTRRAQIAWTAIVLLIVVVCGFSAGLFLAVSSASEPPVSGTAAPVTLSQVY